MIDDGPNDHVIDVMRVINGVWKSVADQSVKILKDDPVGPSCYPETLDIRSERSDKIVTEANLLRLVKQKSLVKILKGFFRNLNPIHGRPIDDFTSSQSRSFDSPDSTR